MDKKSPTAYAVGDFFARMRNRTYLNAARTSAAGEG